MLSKVSFDFTNFITIKYWLFSKPTTVCLKAFSVVVDLLSIVTYIVYGGCMSGRCFVIILFRKSELVTFLI